MERVEQAPAACESTRVGRDSYRVCVVRPAMGTVVSVVAVHPSGAHAEEAIEAAFVEMDRLIGILSRHDSASPLAHLNRTGQLNDTPPELAHVVGQALRYHRLSGGAFDVTVKPLVDLFETATRAPTPAERAEVGELVGAEHVEMSRRRISLKRSGMGITLDGIAKGYIVDQMAEAMARRGVLSFLVNAGGDIRGSGHKEDGCPWTVGVRDPSKPNNFSDVVSLTDGAVASSGNYEKDYEHLFTTTGDGANPGNVCVRAPSAMAADALATALFVMAPNAGRRLAGSTPGCEYFVVDGRGDSVSSPGWTSSRDQVVEHG